MLRSLSIVNFALIDEVQLNFQKGYTVITGETGSGKSILLGALGLILGDRADFAMIGQASDKAVVEAEFDLTGFDCGAFFLENELDEAPVTLIRREITSQGRSRAFINDTPVQLNVLRELTSRLVNIHSQYNTLELKDKHYQLAVLDLLSGLEEEQRVFASEHRIFRERQKELEQLVTQHAQLIQQQDYNSFQLREIEELELDKNNYSELEIELKKADNADLFLKALNGLSDVVVGDDQVLDRLRGLRNQLDKLKGADQSVDALNERVNSVMIELSDIADDAERKVSDFEFDPARTDQIIAKLDKYNRVLRKHNLSSQEELLSLQERLEGFLADTDELQNRINALSQKVMDIEEALIKKAEELHLLRSARSENVSASIKEILEELKLPHTSLEFRVEKREAMDRNGISDVHMIFSANLGIEPVAIERAASGGELSRVMLALQKLISERSQLPTVLFDEIDTGVSGDVAQKIGELLRRMGGNFQLFAISHLPQVAAKADHHFRVEKEISDGRTYTRVKVLDRNERVDEIARLMSGEQISEAAKLNARELMN